jgi:hypothetical protein
VNIEIDDKLIPPGYEAVVKVPVEGDLIVSDGLPSETSINWRTLAIVVRKIYTPPSFFGPGWYAKDKYGNWWQYAEDPIDRTVLPQSVVPNFLVWDKPEGIDKFEVKGDAT